MTVFRLLPSLHNSWTTEPHWFLPVQMLTPKNLQSSVRLEVGVVVASPTAPGEPKVTPTIEDHDKVNLCLEIKSKFVVSSGFGFVLGLFFGCCCWVFVVFLGFKVYRKNPPAFRNVWEVIQWLFPTENLIWLKKWSNKKITCIYGKMTESWNSWLFCSSGCGHWKAMVQKCLENMTMTSVFLQNMESFKLKKPLNLIK